MIENKRRKVCVVVASRANYGRVKPVLKAIQDHPQLELQLIASASALLWRFGEVVKTIREDGFPVDATVYSVVEGENLVTMAKSTGLAISELATIYENLKPDVVITVADRYETISTAIAASYMNIPVAHIQGGEVTGSIDESVRHAITKLSHIHFPATDLSAERIRKLGEHEETIIKVGCPSLDIVSSLGDSGCRLPEDFFKKFGFEERDISATKPFLLVIQHPVTTEYGKGFQQINETLEAVHALELQTVWLWPNIDAGSDDISKGLRVYKENHRNSKIRFFLNFTPEDYIRLLSNTKCIIGNSSSAIREGSFLGTPAVNVGTRQQSRERGKNIIDVAYDSSAIQEAIQKQLRHGPYPRDTLYGDGKAAARIATVLSEADFKIQKTLAY